MDLEFLTFLSKHGITKEEYLQLPPPSRIPLITTYYQYNAMKPCSCGKRFQVPLVNDVDVYQQPVPRDDKLTFSPSSSAVSTSFDFKPEETLLPAVETVYSRPTIDLGLVDKVSFQLPRVLVVDDSLPSRKYLSALLSSMGMQCDAVEDGSIAVAKVSEDISQYGLVFMDRLMPRMNGLDATTKLREMGFRGLILGLTGLKFDEQVIEYLDCGADAMFSKPFSKAQTKALLVHLLEKGCVTDPNVKWTYDPLQSAFVEDKGWC